MSDTPLTLRYYGDPVLRRKAEPVREVTDETRALVEGMFAVMAEARGLGLAGPQVGVGRRVFVLDVEDDEGRRVRRAFINPVMKEKSGSMVGEEGCLSIPGIYADVKRHARVVFEALDETGTPFRIEATGLLARAMQHELDHLDGVLFIDRLSLIRRHLLDSKLERIREESQDPAASPGSGSPL
jgi:peptide deformylase